MGKPNLVEWVRLLGDYANAPGCVLYSAYGTICKGKYYFMGLNPGGNPDGKASIRDSILGLTTYQENAYIDEKWSESSEQPDAMQKRVKFLFETLLNQPLRSVCSTNLIFKKTRSEKQIDAKEETTCWPIHQAILDIVQPGTIITFANKTFRFICKSWKDQLNHSDYQCIASGHGNWRCESISAKCSWGTVKIVRVPHLRRYAINSDTNERIKDARPGLVKLCQPVT